MHSIFEILLLAYLVSAICWVCVACYQHVLSYRHFRNTLSQELCQDMVDALMRIWRNEQEVRETMERHREEHRPWRERQAAISGRDSTPEGSDTP